MAKRGRRGLTADQELNQGFNGNSSPPPACPKKLTGDSRKEWERIVKALHECGRLAAVDHTVIIEAAETLADIGKFRALLAEHGWTYETRGAVVARPEAVQLRQAQSAYRGFLRDLGLNVKERARLGIKARAPEQKDPMTAFEEAGKELTLRMHG